jgi:hypothetical protein
VNDNSLFCAIAAMPSGDNIKMSNKPFMIIR